MRLWVSTITDRIIVNCDGDEVVHLHIVFLVGSYHPFSSAVSNCVYNVALALSDRHTVTVVCEKSYAGQANQETLDGHKVLRFMTAEASQREVLESRWNDTTGFIRRLHWVIYRLYRVLASLRIIFSRTTVRTDLVDGFQKALEMVKDRVDIIIPASSPFESVIAAIKYKSENASQSLIVPYLFDQFAENDLLHRLNICKVLKRSAHIRLERGALLQSHTVLAIHSLQPHFSKEHSTITNILYVEHPLIVKGANSRSLDRDEIVIAYVGSLNHNYVVPHYLLQIFERSDLECARLHFYIRGNCFDVIEKYCNRLPTRAVNHGSVDKIRANKAKLESNILINIGERRGRQVSSKIFEYMSIGKPIVHFYSVDSDINLKILARYPLALCLKQDVGILATNVVLFENFCRRHYNSYVPFEIVEKLFAEAVPKTTANTIENLILP